MRKIIGHKIESLPLANLKRVSNLIEFDGPVLSHFVDEYKNNILYYWVDQDNSNNRWLIWKVNESLLYQYLNKNIPLDFLFPKSGENIYVADISPKLEFSNIYITYSNLIDEDYKPEVESYYSFELPEIYLEKIKEFSLLDELKARALYFNIEPATKRYDITVGIGDIWNVFENLASSFSVYVDHSVKNILSTRITDLNRVNIAAKTLSSIDRLRFVYLNLNSFHFGIAADTLNLDSKSIDPSLEEFHSKVLQQYQNEILDNDFSSVEDIDILISKYPDEEIRKKIFEPVIKIINNDNIKLNITDFTSNFNKTYKRVPKSEKVKLAPSKPSVSKEKSEQDHTLMVAYIVADKNSDQGTLFPKDAIKRLIYAKEIETIKLELKDIILPDGRKLEFKFPIESDVSFENDRFILKYSPLSILISVSNKNELESAFQQAFLKEYLLFKDGNDKTYEGYFSNLLS